LKALELAAKWTDEIEAKVAEILNNTPEPDTDFRYWKPMEGRRSIAVKLPERL
jgi:hypothetical protein